MADVVTLDQLRVGDIMLWKNRMGTQTWGIVEELLSKDAGFAVNVFGAGFTVDIDPDQLPAMRRVNDRADLEAWLDS